MSYEEDRTDTTFAAQYYKAEMLMAIVLKLYPEMTLLDVLEKMDDPEFLKEVLAKIEKGD